MTQQSHSWLTNLEKWKLMFTQKAVFEYLIAAKFIIVKNCKQPKRPSTDEEIH